VKPVASLVGVAIANRLRTTTKDDQVLASSVAHLGRLRGAISRGYASRFVDPGIDGDAKRQLRRDRLNTRRKR